MKASFDESDYECWEKVSITLDIAIDEQDDERCNDIVKGPKQWDNVQDKRDSEKDRITWDTFLEAGDSLTF